MNIDKMKKDVRLQMKNTLRSLPFKTRESYSEKIVSTITTLEEFSQCDLLLTYIPIAYEVNVLPLIEIGFDKGIHVAISRTENTHLIFHLISKGFERKLIKGEFGILEPPCDAATVNIGNFKNIVCIVPALAFSTAKGRLGRGKGYYDRFLSAEGTRCTTVGVGFDCQIKEVLPLGEFDVSMDMIISERQIIG